MRPMYYRHHPLRFQCTGCGDCCTGDPNRYYVEATREEQRAIQRFLGISWRWFRRRYVAKIDDGIESLSMAGGQCTFLDAQRRCTIYSVRPAQCRLYPFWPEIVERRADWKAEAKRCEGINRGEVVPLARIEAALKQQRKT